MPGEMENQVEQETEQPEGHDKGGELNVDEIITRTKDELSKTFKSEIAGLNRRNSELERELEESKKAGMQEQERLDYERQKALEEREAAKREAQEYRVNLLRERKIHGAGLPPDFAKFVTGADETEIDGQIQALQTAINEAATAGIEAEIKKRFPGSGKPEAGKPGGELTYNDLLEMSDEQIKALPDAVYQGAMKMK